MVKLRILALLAVVAFTQIVKALEVAEVYNNNIRHQLSLYEKYRDEADSVQYADELKQLTELTEKALTTETAEEKDQIISSIPSHFSAEFNKWISNKIEESQVNADILDAIKFYVALVPIDEKLKTEINTTISTLENILKETDLKQKEEQFLALEKTFSADLQKFLQEESLPDINRQLQNTAKFFDTLLKDNDITFAKEINALKVKVEAALKDDVSIDDKRKVLREVTFTDNEQLNEFLHKKNVEIS